MVAISASSIKWLALTNADFFAEAIFLMTTISFLEFNRVMLACLLLYGLFESLRRSKNSRIGCWELFVKLLLISGIQIGVSAKAIIWV